jgi:hypothetical protein
MQRINLLFLFSFSLLFFSILTKSAYKVTNFVTDPSRIILTLQYTGKDSYYLKPTSPIVKDLIFTFQVHSFYDFYFKITDLNKKRF